MAVNTIAQGNISLSAIQVETGYATASNISLTQQSLNAKAGSTPANGAPYAMSEWAGYTGILDIQYVTVGYDFGTQYGGPHYGYADSSPSSPAIFGSISDGTSNLYSGANIQALYSSYLPGTDSWIVFFRIAGLHANSGWTTMNANGNIFTRASGSHYQQTATPTYTSWTWGGAPGQNLVFGTTLGAVKTVVWE